MKSKSIILLPALFFLFCIHLTYAQTSINSLGNSTDGSNGEISFSIGELNYQTATGESGSLTQGVQQSYEVIPVFINETIFDFNFKVHPNPTTNQIILKSDLLITEDINYQINTMDGKIVSKNKIKSPNQKIDFRDYKPGVYILKIYHFEKLSRSFKIIKTL